MALKITDTCINCDVCAPVCPNEAIYEGELIYEINPDLCTECVGHFDKPQCQVVCPVECIPWDENHQESNEELLEKSKILQEASEKNNVDRKVNEKNYNSDA